MSISSYICVERKKDDGPKHEHFSESIDQNYFFWPDYVVAKILKIWLLSNFKKKIVKNMRFVILYILNDIIMTELRFNENLCALFKRLLGQWDCIISHLA